MGIRQQVLRAGSLMVVAVSALTLTAFSATAFAATNSDSCNAPWYNIYGKATTTVNYSAYSSSKVALNSVNVKLADPNKRLDYRVTFDGYDSGVRLDGNNTVTLDFGGRLVSKGMNVKAWGGADGDGHAMCEMNVKAG